MKVSLMVLPLFPVAPFFTATLWYSAWNYYHCHRKSHDEPEWARENLPWHLSTITLAVIRTRTGV